MSPSRRILVAVMVSVCLSAASLRASPQTLEEAWAELDGPQPRGPGATVLVDHQPHPFGGFASDSLGVEFPGGLPVWQFVADDFALSQTITAWQLVFWGFYHDGIEPVGDEAIRVRFYDSRPGDGLPGSPLFEQTTINPSRNWTGDFISVAGGPREYRYAVDLAGGFAIGGGTQYWLEVAQMGDVNSLFRWDVSITPPLTDIAASNINFPNWTHAGLSPPGNNAFQLLTPEPTTAALSCCGLYAILARRARRSRQ